MKSFYWILACAFGLDLIVLPWLWNGNFPLKFTLAVLPFAFLFLNNRHTKIVFAVVLVYLRSATGFNLGVIFISLLALAVFERWFLTNFFHKTAWQTLLFSGGGVIIFYIFLFSLSSALFPASHAFSLGIAAEAIASSLASAGLSFLLSRVYKNAI